MRTPQQIELEDYRKDNKYLRSQIAAVEQDRDYWKERCEAAERYASWVDIHLHSDEEKHRNYNHWQQLKNKQP